jgi:hypothetical protein
MAQGLSNGPHELELIGDKGPVVFKALRVYQAALQTNEATPITENTILQKIVSTFAPPPASATGPATGGH